jgi:SAM-dependent methyltransferase
MSDMGTFDFVWCRFILEYHRSNACRVIAQLDQLLRPGGVLCLIDLDHNCLNHAGLPRRLESTIEQIVVGLEQAADFDPYAGRKLYSHLYGLDYNDLEIKVQAHHLIFGPLGEGDRYNWERKVQVAARRSGCEFEDYPGGFEEFSAEFAVAFEDPARFTYTPMITCRGRKP